MEPRGIMLWLRVDRAVFGQGVCRKQIRFAVRSLQAVRILQRRDRAQHADRQRQHENRDQAQKETVFGEMRGKHGKGLKLRKDGFSAEEKW